MPNELPTDNDGPPLKAGRSGVATQELATDRPGERLPNATARSATRGLATGRKCRTDASRASAPCGGPDSNDTGGSKAYEASKGLKIPGGLDKILSRPGGPDSNRSGCWRSLAAESGPEAASAAVQRPPAAIGGAADRGRSCGVVGPIGGRAWRSGVTTSWCSTCGSPDRQRSRAKDPQSKCEGQPGEPMSSLDRESRSHSPPAVSDDVEGCWGC
mmetsp:Transcript_101207/g.325146  ORF Transcript_101207/g.325146 Transcript_101207/m.325146 type:complete len:215 (-) Transcript_101207:714-1358(-)